MEPQVTLNVTFKNETQSFLVSDPENTTWADVEAMVKVSFDLNTIQIKYLDEENEEVSINSQEEYEEALKMANIKQGNQLQMQVHEGCHVVDEAFPQIVVEKQATARTGKKPLAHYSSVVKVLGSDKKPTEEPAAQPCPLTPCDTEQPQDKPPDWFTSYLETFREQVVKETVEKLEQRLQEKLVLQKSPLDSSPSEVPMPVSEETLFLPENQFSWHIACSHCQKRIIGVRYQCSLCPSYNICEDCEAGPYAHDNNHVLLKLRRPVVISSEPFSHLKCPTPRLPAALEQVRLQKQVDKNFVKAEKQRLRAEKKQRKAEVKELKKQLKLHRKIHLWNSIHGFQSPRSPLGRPENFLQSHTLMLPLQPCAPVMPTLSAAFVDENLPDGTHLQPGTKFIKHWRMKNTGNVKWSTDTKLKFMWGNLTLASTEKKDVLVPCLKAGHVGVVSVEFIAPTLEGTYTSHWRLSHKGQQFGPRVWCSIIVDPFPSAESPENVERGLIRSGKADDFTCEQEETFLLAEEAIPLDEVTKQTEGKGTSIPQKAQNVNNERELYIPSVDLLTAQDLLSFELLDINIVQELERVPHNTPVDMTPCMSPLPHDSPLIEKPGLGQIQEESEGAGFKALPDCTVSTKRKSEAPASVEETEEDLSGTQFVCETVIRSLTLDAAPDHNPPCMTPDSHQLTEPADRHPNRKARGQLRTKIESGEGTIPVRSNASIQTWDGVLQGERLLTMSCSDKIARWNVVGIQGSLLSIFVEPIYFSSIILGSLYHGDHLSRAMYQRISNIEDLPPLYTLNKPLLSGISNAEARQPGKAPNFSVNWTVGDSAIEIINATTGKDELGRPSRLCKHALYCRWMRVHGKVPPHLLRTKITKPTTYHESKLAAKEYQAAKARLFTAFIKAGLGAWVEKPTEQDQFSLTP